MMKVTMIFAILAAAFTIDARTGRTEAAPWCAWYEATASDCAYFSRQSCLDTIRGVGGWCALNVREFWAPPQPPPRHPRHARRQDRY